MTNGDDLDFEDDEEREQGPVKAVILGLDGSATLRIITPNLKGLNDAVGGYIELVRLDDNTNMYLNEDGKMLNLPVNTAANRVVAYMNPGLRENDFIVGQVVLTGVCNADGESDGYEYDVPESTVEVCRLIGAPFTSDL